MFGFKELDAVELQGLLQVESDKCILVDVRTPAEAGRGGIAGARNIPLHLLPIVGQEFAKDRPVVLYCHSGARSAQGCSFLAARGFGNVYNLRGGILGWAQSGQPVAPIEPMAVGA